eukprot:6342982-Prymnesium_polylepis.1
MITNEQITDTVARSCQGQILARKRRAPNRSPIYYRPIFPLLRKSSSRFAGGANETANLNGPHHDCPPGSEPICN